MRRTLTLLLACAVCLGLLPGCFQASAAKELTAPKLSTTPSDSEEVSQALAHFGLELLQRTREADQTSTLISPLSVALALTMAANGADGNTLTQFQAVLGGGAELEELNGACVQLTQDYQNLTGATKCSIANSLWVDPDGQIKDEFVGKCRGIFDAQVFQGELSSPRDCGRSERLGVRPHRQADPQNHRPAIFRKYCPFAGKCPLFKE